MFGKTRVRHHGSSSGPGIFRPSHRPASRAAAVLWSVCVALNLDEESEVSVFSKTYVNDTDAPIRNSEKMEQGISVTDTCEIGFTDKISAGYEQKSGNGGGTYLCIFELCVITSCF